MAENYTLNDQELESINGGTSVTSPNPNSGNRPDGDQETHEAYRCLGCNQEFESLDQLRLHWSYNMPCRSFVNTCSHCNKKFPTFEELKIHWNYQMPHRPTH